MAKGPLAKGRSITCPDLRGQERSYPAEELKFRPAAYGILYDQGQVLMSRSRFTGRWDFPGGGVEAFELMPEGLAREFTEETGVAVKVGELISLAEGFIAFFGHPFHSLRFYYRVTATHLEDLSPALDEVSELRWWAIEDIPWSAMHPSDQEALRRTLAGTKENPGIRGV